MGARLSEDRETSRWLIVVGDAPPFGPNLRDPKTDGAVQRVSVQQLILKAKDKNVAIHCILCPPSQDFPRQKRDMVVPTMGTLAFSPTGRRTPLS